MLSQEFEGPHQDRQNYEVPMRILEAVGSACRQRCRCVRAYWSSVWRSCHLVSNSRLAAASSARDVLASLVLLPRTARALGKSPALGHAAAIWSATGIF